MLVNAKTFNEWKAAIKMLNVPKREQQRGRMKHFHKSTLSIPPPGYISPPTCPSGGQSVTDEMEP